MVAITTTGITLKFNHTQQLQYQELDAKIVKGQRWYTTPSGIKYPSVTTILSAGEKPALQAWKESMGIQKADKETKRCSDRGTAVHTMLEQYVNNVEDPSKGHDYQHVKVFNKAKKALSRVNNVRAQEIPLYSDLLKIAGRVDCVAEYKGVLSIIDFKTSTRFKTKDLIHDYFLQCTAYAIMYNELFEAAIEDIVIIIGIEKEPFPLIYTDKIDNYVEPLLRCISMFYKGIK